MSLKNILSQAFEQQDTRPIQDILSENGFDNFDLATFNEALLHYSKFAPLEQAEALAPAVVSHFEQTQNRADTVDLDFGLSDSLPYIQSTTDTEKISVLLNGETETIEEQDLTEQDLAFGSGATQENNHSHSVDHQEMENAWEQTALHEESSFLDYSEVSDESTLSAAEEPSSIETPEENQNDLPQNDIDFLE